MTTQLTASALIGSALIGSISLIPVRDGLWRVTARTGTVLGHIERRRAPGGDRFAARRLVFATLTRQVGEFWNIADAVDCFR